MLQGSKWWMGRLEGPERAEVVTNQVMGDPGSATSKVTLGNARPASFPGLQADISTRVADFVGPE